MKNPRMTTVPVLMWRNAILASDLPSTTRLIALVLSNHMSAAGTSCHPSVETIGRESRRSRAAVYKHLATLEAGGWIRREHRFNNRGEQETSIYCPTYPHRGLTGETLQGLIGETPGVSYRGLTGETQRVGLDEGDQRGGGRAPHRYPCACDACTAWTEQLIEKRA